ncbi:UNVERIFIED_CONTAM: hypothetical protein Scaly_1712500 [Sesamum calycinum]|uniref:Xylanase inhibitor C-terminal domain-containing protein n=1 Tax=Sesamum calycinum TaxID=2727403 RepID=A0AAW2NSZ3_9LAMI
MADGFSPMLLSARTPSGIAGFGRGPESLPALRWAQEISPIVWSHPVRDTPVSSDLILIINYVTLRKITVGGVNVRAPYKFLVPDSDGNGGTIVDSGTTFTFMENPVFELVAQHSEKQVGKNYSRATEVENQSGLRPCFQHSQGKLINFTPIKLPFSRKCRNGSTIGGLLLLSWMIQ